MWRSSSTEAWRHAVSVLRQAPDNGGCASQIAGLQAAVTALLDLCSSGSPLPSDAEVASDTALLAQRLSAAAACDGSAASAIARGAFCQLLTCLLQRSALVAAPPAPVGALCSALAGWAAPPHGRATAATGAERQLQQDAVAALGALLTQHLPTLPPCKRTSALSALLAAVRLTGAQAGNGAGAVEPRGGRGLDGVDKVEWTEAQRLAAHALGSICARGPDGGGASGPAAGGLTAQEVATVQQCLIKALCASAASPRDDPFHGRCYASLLRALSAAVAASGGGGGGWAAQAGTLVDALQRLLTYGWQRGPVALGKLSPTGAAPAPEAAAAAQGLRAAYVPPHLRARRPRPGGDASDSDVSDCEGGAGGGDGRALERAPAPRVRLALLGCVQSMAQADARALQPHLTSLLPVQQPLQPRPLSAHLVTLLLYDPVPRVRAMAAAAIGAVLDGRTARQHLAVAEAKTLERPAVRGFTTLSASLGFLATCVHTGLLHAVRTEPALPVLAAALRALGVACAALPYERLPAGMLADLVTAVRGRLRALPAAGARGQGGDDAEPHASAAVAAAALACIAQALSTRVACPDLGAYLRRDARAAAASCDAWGAPRGAHDTAPAAGAGGADSAGDRPQRTASGAEAVVRQAGEAPGAPELCAGCGGAPATPAARAVRPPPAAERLLQCSVAAELLEYAASSSVAPAARASALSALCGLCQRYPQSAPPNAWPQVCAAVRLNTAAAAAAAEAADSSGARVGSPDARHRAADSGAEAADIGASSGGAASSMEDRAAQQALHLAAEWLTAQQRQQQQQQEQLCDGPLPATAPWPPWEPRQLHDAWRETLLQLAAAAQQHPLQGVRASAAAAAADAPREALAALPSGQLHQLLNVLAATASTDGVTAVRAAACKSLGALALSLPPALWGGATGAQVLAPLAAATQDATSAVRISAAWAVANVCGALRPVSGDPGGTTTAGGAGEGVAGHDAHAHAAGLAPRVLPPGELQRLCLLVLSASHESDKVRASGVRALGNLLAMWGSGFWDADAGGGGGGGGAAHALSDPSVAWVAEALAALQSSLTSGNAKVQWNACYSAAGLFGNAALAAAARSAPALAARLEALLLVLTLLARDSTNLKLRTHAAAALAAPPTRAAYGGAYPDALLVVAGAVEGGPAGEDGAAPRGDDGAHAQRVPVWSEGTGGAAGSGFVDQRYAGGLRRQLAASLMHLLSLAGGAEEPRLRDALARRLPRLVSELRAAAAAAADACASHAATDAALEGKRLGGDARGALQLPEDPFHSSSSSSATPAACTPPAPARAGAAGGAARQDEQLRQLQQLAEQHEGTQVGAAAAGLLSLLGQRM